MIFRLFILLTTLFAASPTWAGAIGGTTVDEPAALALLAVGVVGLIIGRHAAKRRD